MFDVIILDVDFKRVSEFEEIESFDAGLVGKPLIVFSQTFSVVVVKVEELVVDLEALVSVSSLTQPWMPTDLSFGTIPEHRRGGLMLTD